MQRASVEYNEDAELISHFLLEVTHITLFVRSNDIIRTPLTGYNY